jgi:hypothetical protein
MSSVCDAHEILAFSVSNNELVNNQVNRLSTRQPDYPPAYATPPCPCQGHPLSRIEI